MGAAADPLTIVILVDHANVTGGQAKVAFDSARGLLGAGHRPILFTSAGPVSDDLKASGLEVICLDQPDLVSNPSKLEAAVQGFWNFRAVAALAKLLRECPPDNTIVHVHGWAKSLSPAIAKPIRESGFPAIYTIHEYFLFCPNGGFYDYQEGRMCERTPLSGACWKAHCDSQSYGRKLWRNARLAFARSMLGFPDVFSDYVCISALQAGIVRPYLPEGAAVHAVANPIAVDDLGPKTDAAQGDFAFVARVSPEKGPLLFAQAARLAGVTPLFVGDGPQGARLRAEFPEARVTGWVKPEEARAALRAARALVFPSHWVEGQPLAVLEAKALGTPVIVSDVCAGREEIVDGQMGLWFKSGDAQDLARALSAMKDDARVRRMSANAHQAYWRAPPTLDAHVAKIEAIYCAMLARRAATATIPLSLR